MRQNPAKDTANESSKSDYSALSMIIDMANTTWQLFVPVVGMLLVGRYFDSRLGTKPLYMLVGAALGSCIAAFLIRRQIKRNY